MTPSQRLRLEQSEKRQKINELLAQDELNDEQRGELETLTKRMQDLEVETRAAIVVEEAEEKRALENEPDAEMRERIELRSKASLTGYLKAAMAGRAHTGAEAELQSAAGIDEGIPLELWDVPERRMETRADVATSAPSTVGVNLDRIRPAVFANSIAPTLGIEMPRVESGSYASATINASLTAGSQAAGGEAMATAASFAVSSVTPKRISARLGIRIEDVAAVGQANFESILRENLSLVLSDELDDQAINGAGGNSGADLEGILHALTDPQDPTPVVDFDAFVASFAGGVDGLWANTLKDVSIVCGPATYQKSAQTFRDATGQDLGDVAFSDYAMEKYGGWRTNKRMPDEASDIQQGILYRMGRSMQGGNAGMRTAVCPHWNQISIDDIYSGSAKGERYFTLHVLLGDIILVQPSAYSQVAYKLA